MAYTRRYRRRARTYRRYRTGYRSSYRRYGGQFLAARQQRDVARVVLRANLVLSISVPAGQTSGGTRLDMVDVLQQTPMYTHYKSLFDEVRLQGVRLRLVPVWQIGAEAGLTIRPVIAYAWDRNGATQEAGAEGGGLNTIAFDTVASYGSARTLSMGGGYSGNFRTSLYASDLMERSAYMSTLRLPTDNQLAGPNLAGNNLFFTPDFLLGIRLPGTLEAVSTYAWNVEAELDVTFRGVRVLQ